MIFRIADDFDASAALGDRITLWNRVGGVIGALGLNVRTNLADDGSHIELGENHDCVNVSQGGDNLGSLVRRHDGPAFAFERADRFIGIDGDDQPAAQRLRSAQVPHVADMQQIEVTIGQRDAFTGTAPLVYAPAQFFAAQDFAWLFQFRKV
jgi:hypothetical protein